MKGEIDPDHIPLNKFAFRVLGLIDLVAITISGIEDELEVIELPDRTKASGGNRKAGEFELAIPMHHTVARAALEVWFREGQDPVLPTYKKSATLVHTPISAGDTVAAYTLTGVFVMKRTLPDLDKANEGEIALVTYGMSYDDILPI